MKRRRQDFDRAEPVGEFIVYKLLSMYPAIFLYYKIMFKVVFIFKTYVFFLILKPNQNHSS